LVNQGVEWTTATTEEVNFIWAAELENPNSAEVRATVVLRLQDASGEVLHEVAHPISLGPGTTESFTDEGSVAREIAARGANWEFVVELSQ
jgi:hypothetical protein